jgi:hypothetical protein
MAEWIMTIIAILGVIVSIIVFSYKIGKFEERYNQRHEALSKNVADSKEELSKELSRLSHVIGNGDGTGLRYDIQHMQVYCSGHTADVEARLKTLENKPHGKRGSIDE